MIHISEGNTKLGHIPSFSLAPGATCSMTACATCFQEGCYARKLYRLRKTVRNCWDNNTEMVLANLAEVESQLKAWFVLHKNVTYFRIHVSGDFVNKEYTEMWARVAKENPNVKFLTFTKQWDNVRGVEFPDNMTIILSAWPGTEIPIDLKNVYHVAYMDDGHTEIPADAKQCGGDCHKCMSCWGAVTDVSFHKH